MADGGGRAGIGPGGERGAHVIGAAGDDAQADDVDQQPLAGAADCRRQPRGIEGGDAIGYRLGNGRSCFRHFSGTRGL